VKNLERPANSCANRRVASIACAAVCTVVTFAYAGPGWASALYRLLTDGTLALVWLLSAAGIGSVVLRVFPLSSVPGGEGRGEGRLLEFVTAAALGLGFVSLIVLGLGLAGWLNRFTAWTLLAIGLVAGGVQLEGHRPASEFADAFREPAGSSWLWLAAMPFLGLALVAAMLPPGMMWPGEPNAYDVVEYHLQIPREWYELGRIVPLRHNAFSYFPFNVEMHYLLAMHLRGGPWAGMYLAHFMHLSMAVLTVAAVYGLALRFSNSKRASTIATLAVATTPWLTQLFSIAYNEGGFLLFGTLATGWAFDAATRPSHRLGRFPAAGMLAGFACGAKLTAVPEVLIAAGAISLVGIIATPRIVPAVPLRLRILGLATFFVASVVAFSPWLLRNQIWAGNPVFPEAAEVLGKAHFGDAQVQRWKQAHSPRADQRSFAARVAAWKNDVWASWQFGFVLLPVGLIAGVVSAARRSVVAILLIAMFVALSVVWLGFTHLQGRFFIFGVPIAGLLLAGMPWGKWAAVGAGLVLVGAAIGFTSLHEVVVDRLYDHKLAALIGYEELSDLLPQPVSDALANGKPLTLVGEAKAFLYPGPMSRLHYRSVFDVDVRPGESVIAAWARGADPAAPMLVDPIELRRFHSTYYGIPQMPPEFQGQTDPLIITNRDSAR
jgi:hypothetical protein